MIELHGAKTGNCLRVAIGLEVCATPYRVVKVDLTRGEQRSAALLALNPAGKVPTLVERSSHAPPFVLSQSNAILLYLAERAPGVLVPIDDLRLRATAYERFFYFATDVIALSHAAFSLRDLEPRARGMLEQRAVANLVAAERFVAEDAFMAGERFTLADIAAVTIAQSMFQTVAWEQSPKLRLWYERVMRLPSVVRGLHAFNG